MRKGGERLMNLVSKDKNKTMKGSLINKSIVRIIKRDERLASLVFKAGKCEERLVNLVPRHTV
jgi:hypothetical protein